MNRRVRLAHWLSVVYLVCAVWTHDATAIALGLALYLMTEIKITVK